MSASGVGWLIQATVGRLRGAGRRLVVVVGVGGAEDLLAELADLCRGAVLDRRGGVDVTVHPSPATDDLRVQDLNANTGPR